MAAYSGASKKKEPHSYKRIQAELKEDRLKNILLLFGREKYLIRWACEQIRKRYVMSAAELFDFVKIDGSSEDTGRISEACETLPMLSEKRVVLVSDFDESSGRGDEVAEYLKDFPENTVLILVCDSLDKRKKLYKAAAKYGSVYDFDRLDPPMLRSFIAKRFRTAKKEFDPDLSGYFIDVSGYYDKESDYTLDNLVNDIAKTTAHSGERITAEDIENTVISGAKRDVFAFTDALSSGKKGDALRILHSLLESGENVFKLLGLICSQYETILSAHEMRSDGMNLAQMKAALGIHEFRIKKAFGPASRYDGEGLRKVLMKAYEADRNIKTGLTEPETALELFVAGV